jgi:hypothetical protein
MSSQNSQKYLLCKKMNINTCKDTCQRAHSINELEIIHCYKGFKCNNDKCPFIHPKDDPITEDEYFKRMYDYISPYESNYTSVCRYCDIGCKIELCRKAHSVDQLVFSECDCFRSDCPFFHKERDEHISKEQYFLRMKSWVKTIKKSNKNMLCRYINIGCQRTDCPYAHNIRELNVHKCIFNNCKSNCIFLHNYETIDKQEYFERMLDFIEPIKPKTVLCHNKECNNNKCLYAHSIDEYKISECIRGIKCKKHCCPFKHPNENFDKKTYYERMLYSLHPN